MQLLIVPVGPDKVVQEMQASLIEAGHEIAPDRESSELALVLAAPHPDTRAVLSAWREIEAIRSAGLPVRAVALGPVIELSEDVEALPHDGPWIEVSTADAEAVRAALEVCEDGEGEVSSRGSVRSGRISSRLRSIKSRATALRARSDTESSGVSVFVSYSRKDKLAADVIAELRRHGHEVWVDTTAIAGGMDWRASIEKGIDASSVFLLLMSPNAAKNPRYVRQELQYASSKDKQIIPVYLRRTPTLPDGLSLTLGGTQWISLSSDFQQGMGRLLEVIAPSPEPTGPVTLRERASAVGATVKRVSHEVELSKKLKRYGGAAAAGGLMVGAAAVKIMIEQQAETERQRQAAEIQSRSEYRERTLRVLSRMGSELESVQDMDSDAFRSEFAPKFQKALGELTATRPADADLRQRHQRMVEALEGVAREIEELYRIPASEPGRYRRQFTRVQSSGAEAFNANIAWLERVVDL